MDLLFIYNSSCLLFYKVDFLLIYNNSYLLLYKVDLSLLSIIAAICFFINTLFSFPSISSYRFRNRKAFRYHAAYFLNKVYFIEINRKEISD
jgi:hypothetical protein